MGNRLLPSVETPKQQNQPLNLNLLLPDPPHLLMLLHWLPRDSLLIYIQLLTCQLWRLGVWQRGTQLHRVELTKELCHSSSKGIVIQSKCAWQGSIPASALNTNFSTDRAAPRVCTWLPLPAQQPSPPEGAPWRWDLVHPFLPSFMLGQHLKCPWICTNTSLQQCDPRRSWRQCCPSKLTATEGVVVLLEFKGQREYHQLPSLPWTWDKFHDTQSAVSLAVYCALLFLQTPLFTCAHPVFHAQHNYFGRLTQNRELTQFKKIFKTPNNAVQWNKK